MARPPLGPHDRLIPLAGAARRLGVNRSTLHEKVRAKDPTVRGLPPRSDHNASGAWLVSLDDVEAEERRKGLASPAPVPSAGAGPGAAPMTLGDPEVQIEFLRQDVKEERDLRLEQLEREMQRLVAEKDARIAELERQLIATTQALAAQGQAWAVLGTGRYAGDR